MKKLNKVAVLFASVASVALAAPIASLAAAHTGGMAKDIQNWRGGDGATVWKNGTNQYCWRGGFWTPATAAAECDGAIKPPPPPPPVVAAPPPVAAPAPVPVPVPVSEKVTYAADAFFDFDKSVIKPDARAKLDDLVSKIGPINLEVVIAVGHTDSVGSNAYNQKLSVRRATAVKDYLVGKGIEKNRIYTEGKGESQPVATNSTRDGRAKNRRVEIEVVGTRTSKN